MRKKAEAAVKIAEYEAGSARAIAEKERKDPTFDGKTGLYSANGFQGELIRRTGHVERARDSGRTHALVFMDLDDFKGLNDRLGEPIADLVALKPVAKVLAATVREGEDVVGRFGGDEFEVLLSDTDGEGALVACEKIQSGINSIGLAVPEDRESPDKAQGDSLEVSTEALGVTMVFATFQQGTDAEPLLKTMAKELHRLKEEPGKNQIAEVQMPSQVA